MPVVNYTTVNGRILHEDRNGIKTLFMPDTLGNVIETRNMDTGAQTSSTTYWPYGEVRTQTGTNPSPFGFCGVWGYYTQAGQPTYVRARYFRPNLGRWQTVDPLWPIESGYSYADESPVSDLDYSGMAGSSRKKKCDALHQECLNCAKERCSGLWGEAALNTCSVVGGSVGGTLAPGGAAGKVIGGIIGGLGPQLVLSYEQCIQQTTEFCNDFQRNCNERWYIYCDAIARKRCRGLEGQERNQCLKASFAACRRTIGNGMPPLPLPEPIQPRAGGGGQVIQPIIGWPYHWDCGFNKTTQVPRVYHGWLGG